MNRIAPNRIVSAFQNEMDWDKVEEYTEVMKAEMLSHDFPPIMGYESVVNEDDVEYGMCFLDGTEATEEHIGEKIWKVTDGHHRSHAAINACLPYVETEIDYSTITDENEL